MTIYYLETTDDIQFYNTKEELQSALIALTKVVSYVSSGELTL